jgi:hypothetical protein
MKCNSLTAKNKRCKNNIDTCPHHANKVVFRMRMYVIIETFEYYNEHNHGQWRHCANGEAIVAQLAAEFNLPRARILNRFPWFNQYLQVDRTQISRVINNDMIPEALDANNVEVFVEQDENGLNEYSINNQPVSRIFRNAVSDNN